MLGRHNVSASAERFVGPFNAPVTVEIVSMTRVENNTPATMCWIWFDKESCRPGSAYPLEPGTKIEVDLDAGQELYAVTQSVGLLGFSVKGFRGTI